MHQGRGTTTVPHPGRRLRIAMEEILHQLKVFFFDYIPFFLSQILPLLVKSHDTVVPSSESRSVGAKNFNFTMVYGRYIELVVYKPIYNVWGPTL